MTIAKGLSGSVTHSPQYVSLVGVPSPCFEGMAPTYPWQQCIPPFERPPHGTTIFVYPGARGTKKPLRVREGRVDAAGGSGAAVLPLGTLVPLGKAHRSSLKWGVAHMLDARLAHYLLPGATAPEVRVA